MTCSPGGRQPWVRQLEQIIGMMTSSNGNIFRVTWPLWGESISHRWIPLTKASDAELWCFLWSAHEQTVEFLFWMVYCGIWNKCMMGFVRLAYCTFHIGRTRSHRHKANKWFELISPCAAYMPQWIRSALVQIMACRLFGTKPLSKPMLGYCQLDH